MVRLEGMVTEQEACFGDLRGRVALVTGGGSGIGRAIARRLAAEGMKVAICGRRAEALQGTVELIAEAGGEALAERADVSQVEEIERLVPLVAEKLGPVDALVHNAMHMRFPTFEQQTRQDWEASFATGARAAYLLAQQVVPQMKQRAGGGIVLISSVLGQRPNRTGLSYAAVKGALEAMARQMAMSFAPDGIRVNALAPGLILSRREITPERLANDLVPLGRAGTPAEMAAVVAFLLSKQSAYITGQVIHADGGTSVQLVPPGFRL
jgi:3-oxoacyl-[acyl-carrier protein] reductase